MASFPQDPRVPKLGSECTVAHEVSVEGCEMFPGPPRLQLRRSCAPCGTPRTNCGVLTRWLSRASCCNPAWDPFTTIGLPRKLLLKLQSPTSKLTPLQSPLPWTMRALRTQAESPHLWFPGRHEGVSPSAWSPLPFHLLRDLLTLPWALHPVPSASPL